MFSSEYAYCTSDRAKFKSRIDASFISELLPPDKCEETSG